MEQHLVEGADAAAQFLVLSDAPSDEQWAKRMQYTVFSYTGN